MEVLGLKFPVVRPNIDLVSLIIRKSRKIGGLKDGDIVVVSSKIVATSENRIVRLADIVPSARAKALAKVTELDPRFVQVVLHEADRVLGAARGAVLTIKHGNLCANAGVDSSNAPPGYVVLLPENPDASAEKIRKELERRTRATVGVIVADSNVKPLRVGTVGQAIGVAGIVPAVDCRGERDIYGKPLRWTFRAIADQLASAAQLLMGEGAERTPVVIIRGLRVPKRRGVPPTMPLRKDLYSKILRARSKG